MQRVKVKICGITTLQDALAALDAGADLLGFNFYPPSPRYIAPATCAELVRTLRAHGARAVMVGVFVNRPPAEVAAVLDECGLDLAQLSGDEPAEDLALLGTRAFKALRPQDADQAVALAAAYARRAAAPVLLADAAAGAGRFGGTGQVGDWAAAAALAAAWPILLAGGLRPDNVAAAIAAVHPWGVDVASGVESAPGRKDPEKMRAFVTAANGQNSYLTADASRFTSDVSRFTPHPSRLPTKFGAFGGQFVPETLMPALAELETAYLACREDTAFQAELGELLRTYVGRPTPLTHARRLTAHAAGAQIYLKREDLAHSGAHKINNALGQALLAKRLGKRRVIAETGAGQHGVATATACALLGLECVVYMGTVDMARQQPNVQRMRLLGATVQPVDSGTRTLKDAVNEAIRDWVTNVRDTHYLLGSALGPHPYPTIVRDFQAVIGAEARMQIMAQAGRLPDVCMACVGGGSNAIGLFHAFRNDPGVRLLGVEAGGAGIASGRHAARFADVRLGRPGVLHGTYTYVLQDADGQIAATHSISAGLDYAAVGPEHAWLRQIGRAEYTVATDDEALTAFQLLARTEGILPALESAHAVAAAMRLAPTLGGDQVILVNLSGRGDKDLDTVLKTLDGKPTWD